MTGISIQAEKQLAAVDIIITTDHFKPYLINIINFVHADGLVHN